jgi:hypothetical protein
MSDMLIAAVEKQLETAQKTMDDFKVKQAAIVGDTRLSAQAKTNDVKTLSDETELKMKEIREWSGPKMAELLNDFEEEERQVTVTARVKPTTTDEWVSANARANFVKEDIERLAQSDPAEVVRSYRRAMKAGDRVEAYLIGRYAASLLKPEHRKPLLDAIGELEPVNTKKLEEIKAKKKKVKDLQTGFIRTPSPSTLAQWTGRSSRF